VKILFRPVRDGIDSVPTIGYPYFTPDGIFFDQTLVKFIIAEKKFIEEYQEFLEKFEVPFDERYLFKPADFSEEG
jgi:hypothetical protein